MHHEAPPLLTRTSSVRTRSAPACASWWLIDSERQERDAQRHGTSCHLYDRFNARDMEAVLAYMHRDVVWANGMEGGHVSDTMASATTGRDNGR